MVTAAALRAATTQTVTGNTSLIGRRCQANVCDAQQQDTHVKYKANRKRPLCWGTAARPQNQIHRRPNTPTLPSFAPTNRAVNTSSRHQIQLANRQQDKEQRITRTTSIITDTHSNKVQHVISVEWMNDKVRKDQTSVKTCKKQTGTQYFPASESGKESRQ